MRSMKFFEFPHIAGPVVFHEDIHALGTDVLDLGVGGARVILEEFTTQKRNVRRDVAQRGHVDGYDVEPVIEVLAKVPPFDLRFQILVGRRDNPDIHGDGFGPAHPLEFFLL